MSISDQDRRIVESLFHAMQAGLDGEEEMMGLFAEGATFIEPFSGEVRRHEGKAAIRDAFRDAADQPPDMKLNIDRVDLDGERVRADWTCTSSVFPEPVRGADLFTIEDGLITHLEVIVTSMLPTDH